MAEEGWFWMLGKLRQTLQSQPSLQGTWQSASSIPQGLPQLVVTEMLKVKELWKLPPFHNWIPAQLCHSINVFSNIYVVELGVLFY